MQTIRFTELPLANLPPAHPMTAHQCDECYRADWAKLFGGGEIMRFFLDSETGEKVCEDCKAKREATA